MTSKLLPMLEQVKAPNLFLRNPNPRDIKDEEAEKLLDVLKEVNWDCK